MKKSRFVLFSFAALAFLLSCQTVWSQKPAEYTSRDDVAKNEVLNRDFNIQGEYKATIGDTPFAANVIARDKGDFDVVVFIGGLPGDGWNRNDMKIFGKAKLTEDGNLEVSMTETEAVGERKKLDPAPPAVLAKRSDNTVTLIDPESKMEFRFEKVERKSPTEGQAAPEGAIVLFADGKKNDDMWNRGEVNEDAKTLWSEAETKPFEKKPYTMHIEFLLSYMPGARGQGRANSGVYIDQAYECQVLDSFGLDGKNNECGGFYTVAEPIVNMCYPPLQWQTYDIDFVPAQFDAEGNKTDKAKITIRQNGVLIHDGIRPEKETPGCKKEGPEARGLYLQGHGNRVQYRNIWIKYND